MYVYVHVHCILHVRWLIRILSDVAGTASEKLVMLVFKTLKTLVAQSDWNIVRRVFKSNKNQNNQTN